ncbi:hypothetical protein P170DRAFT_511244 [Aspergillus steynii IBT 23096]|uniref:Mid2 domain-containing protein n=1 Tax=Aspergillus steynii IBT 23096 TaxID=1392250 RepID=A0A2I2G0S1_9EURO|nr:uncharacterized protein P170DRAFT_511244 [Aspergillus steynii IBT 23096]PLB46485.1 hypothetical protein P170DRAFT_511244 [Aspergillus steynii IBT 23096]
MTTTLPTATTTNGPPPSVRALTTTFTPAPTCTDNFYMLPYAASGFACMVGDTSSPCQYLHLGPSTASDCMPPDWSTGTDAYYSPGVCPTGYTEACSNLVSVGTVTETRATCCPSSYICQTDTYWPWYADNGCTKIVDSTEVYTYTTDDPDDGLITTTSEDKYGVNAYAVTIRYQSADKLPPTTSATTTSAPTSTTSSTTSTTSSAATSSPDSSGLSSGAKAGIGVGVAAGVVLLLVAVGFWLFRRRKANAAAAVAPTTAAPGTNGMHNPAESSQYVKHELAGAQIHPMPELAGSQLYPGQAVSHHVPAPEPVELGTGRE